MTQWAVIVAMKDLDAAKTRLALPDELRRPLVLAMLHDTLSAASEVTGVTVLLVTDDSAAATVGRECGATIRGGEPAGGLNAAVGYGALVSRNLWGAVPVASLPGDLPALRAADLAAALDAAAACDRSFVPDADGGGTTLLCAHADLRPAYGPDSAARHEAQGAVRLSGQWDSLRRDVDTLAALDVARLLGPGAATAQLLASGWLERARQAHQPERSALS